MADVKRESGFYWVKILNNWFICEWSGKHSEWWAPGDGVAIESGEFDEIDERRITRD